jgi:hypothetical protein
LGRRAPAPAKNGLFVAARVGWKKRAARFRSCRRTRRAQARRRMRRRDRRRCKNKRQGFARKRDRPQARWPAPAELTRISIEVAQHGDQIGDARGDVLRLQHAAQARADERAHVVAALQIAAAA